MLARWNPWNDLMQLEDSLFPLLTRESNLHRPAVDVIEEDHGFILRAELPGVKPDQVEIGVEGNVLSIRAERSYEGKRDGNGYRRIERHYGTFQRSFTLPDTVDTTAIDAVMEDGVLDVRVPKKEAAAPRKIKVRTGSLTQKAKKLFSKPEAAADAQAAAH